MLYQESNQTNKIEFEIDPQMDGERLDSSISHSQKKISRNRAQALIQGGNIKVNGKVVTSKKHKVSVHDLVEITYPESIPLDVKAEDIELSIVYEDDDIIVVDKQKGMVVHPAAGNLSHTMVNALLFHCKDSLSSINGVIRPGIVHRIDKDTSGLLVVAKNDEAHRFLSSQLADHSMEREYRAIVQNNIKQDSGTIDAPIGRDPKNRLRNKVIRDGRSAITHFQVMERFGKYTYIKLNLETGRTHQIRVHMSHVGNPLLGDGLYSSGKNPFGVKSQMLHAGSLGFRHPATNESMRFESPLPIEFKRVLDILRTNK